MVSQYFPPLEEADEDGLIAISEDYSIPLLLDAYMHGIFPWPYDDDAPIGWFSPDPRGVLFFDELHLPRSYQKWEKRIAPSLKVTFNQSFTQVMEQCAKAPRKGQNATWITSKIIDAYSALFAQGYAYSCEIWQNEQLVAGLYGVHIHNILSGESMFTHIDNGSKYALVRTIEHFKKHNIQLMDTQMTTDIVARFGGREIPRHEYLKTLKLKQD